MRQFSGGDENCTAPGLCCWLKPDCAPGQETHFSGAVSAFREVAPGPPLPTPPAAYEVAVDHGAAQLRVARVDGGARSPLAVFNTSTLENGIVAGAWNLLRVVVSTDDEGAVSISVWLNPSFPEVGFVGDPATDAGRTPLPLPPRITVVDWAPLAAGGFGVSAGGGDANVDYASVLPLSVLQ